jgi:hypothetical protein
MTTPEISFFDMAEMAVTLALREARERPPAPMVRTQGEVHDQTKRDVERILATLHGLSTACAPAIVQVEGLRVRGEPATPDALVTTDVAASIASGAAAVHVFEVLATLVESAMRSVVAAIEPPTLN